MASWLNHANFSRLLCDTTDVFEAMSAQPFVHVMLTMFVHFMNILTHLHILTSTLATSPRRPPASLPMMAGTGSRLLRPCMG